MEKREKKRKKRKKRKKKEKETKGKNFRFGIMCNLGFLYSFYCFPWRLVSPFLGCC